ncbi:hypothetical protein Avbf_16843 [Armadillidium vulgare]|nr:hypothetical protein Avbf_16843 [Armadillidium vulgare]
MRMINIILAYAMSRRPEEVPLSFRISPVDSPSFDVGEDLQGKLNHIHYFKEPPKATSASVEDVLANIQKVNK